MRLHPEDPEQLDQIRISEVVVDQKSGIHRVIDAVQRDIHRVGVSAKIACCLIQCHLMTAVQQPGGRKTAYTASHYRDFHLIHLRTYSTKKLITHIIAIKILFVQYNYRIVQIGFRQKENIQPVIAMQRAYRGGEPCQSVIGVTEVVRAGEFRTEDQTADAVTAVASPCALKRSDRARPVAVSGCFARFAIPGIWFNV